MKILRLNPLRVLLLALCLTLPACAADKPAATGEAKIFDVRKYGATGDGKTLDTAAIQKALDECGKAGGGTVLIPGGTYLSKPITLRNKTTLQLDEGAKLQATDERADFQDPAKPGVTNAFIAFINGKKLKDVAIVGKGIIDGAGAKWWVPAEAARRITPGYTLPRPRLILISDSQNVRVEGVTLQNSPTFHFVPTRCEDVVVRNVIIKAPADSPNTDGIDPSASRRVTIAGCIIDCGDDNIAIKAGSPEPNHTAASEDITVSECIFKHGHGMSIGSETVGGVRHVVVRNCSFENTENGLRIKSRRGKGGLVEDISYSNITMKNVNPAISIACYYQDLTHSKFPVDDPAQPVTKETPIFRNIRISNVTATATKDAGLIAGLPESLVSDVVLENIQITAPSGFTIGNAKGVQLKSVQMTISKGPPLILHNAEVDGTPQTVSKP